MAARASGRSLRVVSIATLVLTLLGVAGVPRAGAGERLVFDTFIGARLTPTGEDPNRDYFFAAGVAVDSRGVAYVPDPVNDRVLIYDGTTVTRLVSVCCVTGSGVNAPVFLKFPMSVAVDPRNDDVWITNTLTGHVIKMDKNQRLLDVFGGHGTGPGQFLTPVRAAVDPAGNLYVLDDGGRTCDVSNCSRVDANVRIQKFRGDGTFLRTWGSFCEFSFDPSTGIFTATAGCNAAAPGAVAAGDGQFGFRFQLAVVTDTGLQGFEVSLVGMAVDSAGNVYVSEQGRVQKFDTNGILLLQWPTAATGTSVAVDFADNVYVAEGRSHRVRKFDGAGTLLATAGAEGRGLGVFKAPAFVAALPRNLVAFCEFFIKPFDPTTQCRKIYVSEVGNIRVQVLQARNDGDDDSLVDEVDLDPATVSDEAAVGDAGAHVLTRGGARFVVYDPPGAASPDTIRFTTESSASPVASNVALFCRNPQRPFGTITIAGDNALDFHCSTPTLDVLTGPIAWTFTGADGTVATATLNDGDSLSVDSARSHIQSNAGPLAVSIGGASITLAAGQATFADTTAPTTQADVSPASPPTGWNSGDVTVTLTATDNAGGSGVQEIAIALGGAHNSATTVFGGAATVPLTMEGTTTLTYFARDRAGNQEASKTLTVRIDRTPPTLTCSVSPSRLWPPNNRMVAVTATVALADTLSSPATFALTAVTSNEAVSGGDVQGFEVGTADTAGLLRARRAGGGRGRIYTLTYEGTDQAGNRGTCTATVEVPHDQGQESASPR